MQPSARQSHPYPSPLSHLSPVSVTRVQAFALVTGNALSILRCSVQTLRAHPDGTTVARGGIHGGPKHQLQSGAITGSGKGELLTVVFELLDVSPEDGGFGAVTGSHHTRYQLPISRTVDPVSLTYPDEFVTRVSAKAGSAIVFTEYMMHTTYVFVFVRYSHRSGPSARDHVCAWPDCASRVNSTHRYPWTGKGERKSIFCKYSSTDLSVPTLARHGRGKGISIDAQPGCETAGMFPHCFQHKPDHFAKTGSGQPLWKAQKKNRCMSKA